MRPAAFDMVEFAMVVASPIIGFDAFADAVASLNVESTDNEPEKLSAMAFAFVNPLDTAELRKALGEQLKYVEAFARTGYIGTVAGVSIFTKKDAKRGTVVIATSQAVTIFNKRGTEIEQKREPNIRKNEIYSRKYYVVALTDETKAVRILKGTAKATEDTTKQDGKTYYKQTDSGFIVGTPKSNPKTEGFFEIA